MVAKLTKWLLAFLFIGALIILGGIMTLPLNEPVGGAIIMAGFIIFLISCVYLCVVHRSHDDDSFPDTQREPLRKYFTYNL